MAYESVFLKDRNNNTPLYRGAFGNTFIAVGTSQLQILGADADRDYLAIQNNTANPVFLAFGTTANINQGYGLGATLSSIVFDNVIPTNKVNAIAVGATTILLVTLA